MNTRVLYSIGTIALLIGAVCIAFVMRERSAAAGDLDRILAGDASISLTSMEIEYQQRRVNCTDLVVLDSLASFLRTARRGSEVGTMYSFTFSFSTGRQYSLLGYARPGVLTFAVPSAGGIVGGIEHWPTHVIELPETIPNRLGTILDFLDAPWEDVAGCCLDVHEASDPVYTYQPNLHDRNPPGTRVGELVMPRKH